MRKFTFILASILVLLSLIPIASAADSGDMNASAQFNVDHGNSCTNTTASVDVYFNADYQTGETESQVIFTYSVLGQPTSPGCDLLWYYDLHGTATLDSSQFQVSGDHQHATLNKVMEVYDEEGAVFFDVNLSVEWTASAAPTGSTYPATAILDVSGGPLSTMYIINPLGPTFSASYTVSDAEPPPPSLLGEPPTAQNALDINFNDASGTRTGIPSSLANSINIRELYRNGQPIHLQGGDLYNAGSIGNQAILDEHVQQAIDIFSPNGQNYFEGGAVFCLRGQGSLIWMAAKNAPRLVEVIGSYTVPEYEGFTCATLFEPGTLVLVDS